MFDNHYLYHTVDDHVDESISYIKHILHEMGFFAHPKTPLLSYPTLFKYLGQIFFKEAKFTFKIYFKI